MDAFANAAAENEMEMEDEETRQWRLTVFVGRDTIWRQGDRCLNRDRMRRRG
jgi:hypothetical protein